VEDTLGNKIEDMGKAMSLVSSTRKALYKHRQMFDHRVIVRGIVAGDTKDLEPKGKFLWFFNLTYNFTLTRSRSIDMGTSLGLKWTVKAT
jgi:hypothetical protein